VAGSAAPTAKTGTYFAPVAAAGGGPYFSMAQASAPRRTGSGFCETLEVGWLAMRRLLPPQHVVGLLVAGLLCLMAAGVATMAKYGPKRRHVYAALQQEHR
jgi:hypothetical protein